MSGARAGRTGRVVRRVLVVGAALVLAELLLRAADVAPPDAPHPLRLQGAPEAEPFSRPDPLLLFAIAPSSRTYAWYEIEEHGYRTPPFEERRPEGALRVAVTGDSTTFGLGVREGLHWAAVLRRALAGLAGDLMPTEVIDAGVTGYSTLQNRLQAERDLLPLDPQVLVVLVSGANDSTQLEGDNDAERVATQAAWWRRLCRTRLAGVLGLGRFGWAPWSDMAAPGSTTSRPRVSVAEARENLRELADLAGERLVLGLFTPTDAYRTAHGARAVAAAAAELAAARGVPLADVRDAAAEHGAFAVHLDPVHPRPYGHALIAREVLRASLPRLPLPPARAAWVQAWFAAQRGELLSRADALRGPGAPPRFLELLVLCEAPGLDARLREGDPTLPACLLDDDPLLGRAARARSTARALREGAPPELLAELDAHVRPADPLVACFGGRASFLAAGPRELGLGRAVLAFAAELGMPSRRVDLRCDAAAGAEPEQAAALLHDVLALDPDDERARFALAVACHRLGRLDAERAEYERLAQGRGPLSALARGVLAQRGGRAEDAELALLEAVALDPAQGWAHAMLGRLYLGQDRLDEAAREVALAAALLGRSQDLTDVMGRIDARRAELAAGNP